MRENRLADNLNKAVDLILNSSRTTSFTGAGISVESGILPFRGAGGLWNKFDPVFLDIDYFHEYPEKSWKFIKEIFYDFFGKAKPNTAHYALSELEKEGLLQSIITQNIDNLHQQAGSAEVYEFHGNSRHLICTNCSRIYVAKNIDLSMLPPKCEQCNSLLKPDFVFFGEPIPELANSNSFGEIAKANVFVLIGTSGEIMPASMIPYEASKINKSIIEINIAPSNYTNTITDVFLQGKATEIMQQLLVKIRESKK